MVKSCAKGGCKTETEHGKGKKRPGRPCKSGGAGNIKKRVETEHGVEKRRYGRPCKGDDEKKHSEKKKAPAKKGRAVKGAASKTHPGDKDYTTKKGDKDFHEKGHDVKKARKPYKKKAEKEDKQIVDKRLGNVVEQNAGKHKQSPVQRRAKQGVSKPQRYITEVHSAGY
tara:strand:- start:2570 stop:3076 length:507 start_codon:yes stop_codon:yes gene_type:complete